MANRPFVSYAQNREDVVLHRALGGIEGGRYIDVGAQDPKKDSISWAFYELGWRGITVDPVAFYADRHRDQRPGDIMVQAAITETDGGTVVLHEVENTGLSTLDDSYGAHHREAGLTIHDVEVPTRRLDAVLTEAGWQDKDIHFMTVDTEGAEEGVLRSLDLRTWRPWVLAVEATLPNSPVPAHQRWQPIVLDAGYQFCLFDGLSRFYVADERADPLSDLLSYPACSRDQFSYLYLQQLDQLRDGTKALRDQIMDVGDLLEETTGPLAQQLREARDRLRDATETVDRWRWQALQSWSSALALHKPVVEGATPEEVDFLRQTNHHLTMELLALQRTLSWRVTRPLRGVRRLIAMGRR